jgi:hypothetical protein
MRGKRLVCFRECSTCVEWVECSKECLMWGVAVFPSSEVGDGGGGFGNGKLFWTTSW